MVLLKQKQQFNQSLNDPPDCNVNINTKCVFNIQSDEEYISEKKTPCLNSYIYISFLNIDEIIKKKKNVFFTLLFAHKL